MDIIDDHWYSLFNADNLRVLIGEKGKKNLLCLCLNPSTAKPGHLDPTLKRLRSIANANGYDGWIMFNLYPCGGREHDGIPEEYDEWTIYEHGTNLSRLLDTVPIDTVWCAWGKVIEMRPYLKHACVKWIQILDGLSFVHTVTGIDGHPAFPLYQPKDAPLVPFDTRFYLKNLTAGPRYYK